MSADFARSCAAVPFPSFVPAAWHFCHLPPTMRTCPRRARKAEVFWRSHLGKPHLLRQTFGFQSVASFAPWPSRMIHRWNLSGSYFDLYSNSCSGFTCPLSFKRCIHLVVYNDFVCQSGVQHDFLSRFIEPSRCCLCRNPPKLAPLVRASGVLCMTLRSHGCRSRRWSSGSSGAETDVPYLCRAGSSGGSATT